MRLSSLFFVLAIGGSLVSAKTDDPPFFYTCDELTPDLCELKVEEGQVEIRGINVSYWKYTSSDAPSNHSIPIVALHGGPSFSHHYMLPLKQQACRGRPIYFYDQAGCGSSVPSKNFSAARDHPWLLDPGYYATEELPALLKHWQLKRFHLVGNSWGTMLAQLYALDASETDGLASMVLSGPFSDSQSYIRAQWGDDEDDGTLGGLPPFIQQRIQTLEAQHAYESPEYEALDNIMTGFFTLRTEPAPDCWLTANAQTNMEIYVAMQGPSEFTMSGVLEHTNVTGRLHEITVPVLLSHGRYDTMRPSIVKTMQELLPYAERLYLNRSGHASMIDEPGPMNDGIADFLDRVEESTFGAFNLTTGFAPKKDIDSEDDVDHYDEDDCEDIVNDAIRPRHPFLLLLPLVAIALMIGYIFGYRSAQQKYAQYTAIG